MQLTQRSVLGSDKDGFTGSSIDSNSKVDVVVIGAGISGLIAARDLEKQNRSTTVLEAQERIGGRCHRMQTINNWWLDLGGQWMGQTNHLFRL